jgi:hypothetical protein
MDAMMLMTAHTARAIRLDAGVEPDDTSMDQYLSALSDRELFEHYCEHHGLIGWSDTLICALDSIRTAKRSMCIAA